MGETADAFERELKWRDSSRGGVEGGCGIGQTFAGNVSEKFEGEVKPLGMRPAHGKVEHSGLQLALKVLERGNEPWIQRNRDESPNGLCVGCDHNRRIRRVPAG